MPFLKEKRTRDVRFVVMTDDHSDIHQWSISRGTVISVSILGIVLCSALLFFTADILTQVLYTSRLNNLKENNRSLVTLFQDLKYRLENLEVDVTQLGEKDRALRTYANLPLIDQDIRQVGIGGFDLNKHVYLDNLIPEFDAKISELELDIDILSRQVKLEKESYETIYKAIQSNSDLVSSIPSIRPLNGGYLNTGYGYRRDPFTSERRFHYGQDISGQKGMPVYVTADGKVAFAGYKGSFGRTIKINHGHGYQTLYAHLNRINVKSGQEVKRGDFIGEVGNTGRSTASHLHYEVHYYGTPQDPQSYFFTGPLR